MKDLALLEYLFMFDPSSTWTHLYQFESDLVKFFTEHGMEASLVPTITGGEGRRMIFLAKKQEVIANNNQKNPVGRPPSIGTMFRKIEPVKKVRAAEKKFRNRAK